MHHGIPECLHQQAVGCNVPYRIRIRRTDLPSLYPLEWGKKTMLFCRIAVDTSRGYDSSIDRINAPQAVS
jgi:hypothetical protein